MATIMEAHGYSCLEKTPRFRALVAPEKPRCTIYRGVEPPKRKAMIPYNPWTLQDQASLCETHPSRQSHRQTLRMIVRAFVTEFTARAVIAKKANATQVNSAKGKSTNSNAGKDILKNPVLGLCDTEANDADDHAKSSAKPSGSGRSAPKRTEPATQGKSVKGKGLKRKVDDDEDDHDHNDDANDGDQSKVPTKKTKRSTLDRRPSPPMQPASIKISKADADFANIVSELLESKDIGLKNAKRIAATLKNVKLARIVSPIESDRTEARLEDILTGPLVAGRDVRPLSRARRAQDSVWLFKFASGGSTTEEQFTLIRVPYVVLPTDASLPQQLLLHNQLAKQYNIWPHPFSTLKNATPLKTLLIAVASQNIWSHPLQVEQAYHSNGLTYQNRVNYVDADTGSHDRISVSAAATEAAMLNVVVPSPLPTLNLLDTSAMVVTTMTPDQPHHIAPPDNPKVGPKQKTSTAFQHKAEDAVYWLSAQLQGLVATKSRMKELLAMYRRQIGLSVAVQDKSGIYGGESNLSYVTYRKGTGATVVRPTKTVANDLGSTARKPRVFDLNIYSLNANRATPVLDTILQLFCAGFDLREVWIEAAKTADCVNMDIHDGVAPTSRCDCDETRTGTEMHVCEGCTAGVLCKLRSFDSLGRLVCVSCSRRDQLRVARGKRPGETLAAYIAHLSLRRNFKHECAIRGIDSELAANKQIFEAAFEHVKKQLPGAGDVAGVNNALRTKYVDQWTSTTFDVAEERPLVGTNPSRRRYTPQGLTVDTIHRQGEPNNLDLKHSGTNILITSNACQMAHGSFNPAVMHEISAFKSANPGSADQQSDESRKALVEVMTAMATVNIKRRYINAGSGSRAAKYQKILAEAVAGRPTPNEPGPWDELSQQYVKQVVPPYRSGSDESIWSDETWSRTQQCAQSTADLFGVALQVLPDGTLWIGQKYTTPKDFDRNGLAVFLRERLLRLRLVCNKKWKTCDTDETLYQEIIFQYCCMMTTKPELQWLKNKYGDRLSLPFVLFWNSPLRLSIAHRLHGFAMFTGWLNKPTNVSERIKNDAKNNMLMETWYINSAKFDMAEEYYDDLDRILSNVTITDQKIYRPGPPKLVSEAIPSTVEVSAEETFAGPLFDSSVATADDAGKIVDDQKTGEGEAKQDVEMVDAGGSGGGGDDDAQNDDDDDVELAKGIAASLAQEESTDFSPAVSAAYQTIIDNEKLRGMLVTDAELRRTLGTLQHIADHPEEADAKNSFNDALDRLYKDFVDPNS